jgi:uncharacterized protein YjbI with pentapeptide repeats
MLNAFGFSLLILTSTAIASAYGGTSALQFILLAIFFALILRALKLRALKLRGLKLRGLKLRGLKLRGLKLRRYNANLTKSKYQHSSI